MTFELYQYLQLHLAIILQKYTDRMSLILSCLQFMKESFHIQHKCLETWEGVCHVMMSGNIKNVGILVHVWYKLLAIPWTWSRLIVWLQGLQQFLRILWDDIFHHSMMLTCHRWARFTLKEEHSLFTHSVVSWLLTGGCLSIKTPSCQYRDSYNERKMVLWPAYVHNGTLHIC